MPNETHAPSAPTRLFTPAGVAIGTLLGSLIAAVVMVWLNYRVLGYPGLANRFAACGILLYLLIIAVTSLLPNSPAIAVAIIAGQCGIAWWSAKGLQGAAIEYHRSRGGAVHGSGVAGLVGLATGLVAAAILLLAARLFGLPIGVR